MDCRFDAVVHFAGLKAVGESVQKPLLYFNNNLIGTITLLEVMASHGCKKVLYLIIMCLCDRKQILPIKAFSCGNSCMSYLLLPSNFDSFNISARIFLISHCLWLAEGGSMYRRIPTCCHESLRTDQGMKWMFLIA